MEELTHTVVGSFQVVEKKLETLEESVQRSVGSAIIEGSIQVAYAGHGNVHSQAENDEGNSIDFPTMNSFDYMLANAFTCPIIPEFQDEVKIPGLDM